MGHEVKGSEGFLIIIIYKVLLLYEVEGQEVMDQAMQHSFKVKD